ncbi:MAG: acyl-CoA dehydratase activase-related protein, partial [Limnochordia bacterium]
MAIRQGRKTVGIPRALWYYYLYPFFKGVLEELGAQIILSPVTTQALLADVELCPTDEPCISLKLLFAHTRAVWKQNPDYLLLPSLVSVERGNFCCPKFIGAPDMLLQGLDIPRERALVPIIDFSQGDGRVLDSLNRMGRLLGRPGRGRAALAAGRRAQEAFYELAAGARLTTPEIYSGKRSQAPAQGPTIGVVSHPYVLYEWITHDLIGNLRRYGPVLTTEMIPHRKYRPLIEEIYEGEQLWSFEAHILGAALQMIKGHLVEKLILVGCFECGPASIIETFIEAEAHKAGLPFLNLRLDEHTGQAGLITRIEAFMETTPLKGERRTIPRPGPTKGIGKLGVPTSGHLDIPLQAILEEWGVDYIIAPPISRGMVARGEEMAPEFICFPFTALIGQMGYLLEHGADSLLMLGGKGRCRLGWYAQVQELLLTHYGHHCQMVIIDSPLPLTKKLAGFRHTLSRITGPAPWSKIIGGLRLGLAKLQALERGEELLRWGRAFEGKRGQTDLLWEDFKRRLAHSSHFTTLAQIEREFRQQVQDLYDPHIDPLRVRLVGEIWVLMEPYANLDMEKLLGNRDDVRVWVHREVGPGA